MEKVRINKEETLSEEKYPLKKYSFERLDSKGKWQQQVREVYDHGNAVTALLYNRQQDTVLLTRQFRLPVWLSEGGTGLLTETCAGLIEDGEDPASTMKREIEEETGYKVDSVQLVFEAYTSAGFSQEKVYFYLAEYQPHHKETEGGGLEEEGEDIEVVELGFDEAWQQLQQGEIHDVKTIVLLQHWQMLKKRSNEAGRQ